MKQRLASILRRPGAAGTPLIVAIGVASTILTGCATPPPAEPVGLEAPQADPPPTPQEEAAIETILEPRPERTLDDEEQREVLEAIRGVAVGASISERPVPAPRGVRWSDVPYAAKAASRRIEAAVVRSHLSPDRRTYRFELKTIDDWPGVLIVKRDPETVYRAEASLGMFPEAPHALERRDALLEAFADEMRLYGKRRQFPGDGE